jgi:hypothetical protein
MIPTLLMIAATAAEPPPTRETFDLSRLDDPGPWHEQSRILLDGPDGCIEVQGTVRIQMTAFTPSTMLSTGSRRDAVALGTFEGRLDHGVWTTMDTTWNSAPDHADILLEYNRFRPIVGRLPARTDPEAAARAFEADLRERFTDREIEGISPPSPDNDGSVALTRKDDQIRIHIDGNGNETMGLLYTIIEEIAPDGTAFYATWDNGRNAVMLNESVPLSRGKAMAIDVEFPEGKAPTRLDATLPRQFRPEGEGGMMIRDAQLHVRSKVTPLGVVPGVEGVSAVMKVFGFTLGFDQRVAYQRIRACSGS